MARRARTLRAFLREHPWGLRLIDSRPEPSLALLRHHDRMLGCLLEAGFPMALAVRSFAVLDAYIYGFVLTEQTVPVDVDASADDFAAQVAPPADEFPHLARMLSEHVVGRDDVFADEFDFGLELLLDGIAGQLAAGAG